MVLSLGCEFCMWTNLPQWKDVNREQYIKMLSSRIDRLEKKQYRSAHEEKQLQTLKMKVNECKMP